MRDPLPSKRTLVRRRRRYRRIATSLLLFHLLTVIAAPASVDPTSPFWLAAWDVVRPYAQTVYLDQGWNFFSPEPGSSTLVEFKATLPDGRVVDERIPNKSIYPRLLYHRHFMLTSYMGFFDEEMQVRMCKGYADHVKNKWQAEDVELTMLVHQLPTREHIGDGGGLDHDELWDEFSLDELQAMADELRDQENEADNSDAEDFGLENDGQEEGEGVPEQTAAPETAAPEYR